MIIVDVIFGFKLNLGVFIGRYDTQEFHSKIINDFERLDDI